MAKKKKNIARKLIHHYRWVILDEDENKPKISFRLNFLNSLLIFAVSVCLIVGATVLLLKYSPIKQYFIEQPQDKEIQYKTQLLQLHERLQHLQDSVAVQTFYLSNLQKVLKGELKAAQVDTLMAKQSPVLLQNELLQPSEEDSLFRIQMAQEELEALKQAEEKQTESPLLFPPVDGIVTAHFDLTENHLAIDIAAPEDTAVKATEEGVVIYSGWNPETGNTLILQHPNNLISVYKHNSKTLKNVGDEVAKGEGIALVGSTGELSTGPHLHFELWLQGKVVDPEDFIDF